MLIRIVARLGTVYGSTKNRTEQIRRPVRSSGKFSSQQHAVAHANPRWHSMRIDHRPYRDHQDLYQIGRLIRRVDRGAPHCNAWSFARFDIHAYRWIADEQVHGKRDWHHGLRLWELEGCDLVSAVLLANDHRAALFYDPKNPETVEAMLAWAEERYTESGTASKPLIIEAMAGNALLEHLLRTRDYVKLEGHYIYRVKPLVGDRVDPVMLPDGFYVKPIETLEELQAFHQAVEAVFDFQDSVEVYRILQQAPSYVPELDLILLSAEGDVGSFCTAWLDTERNVAEFEPVGTVPAYRKRGLAAAILAEASNRLRAVGCRKATVFSWSGSAGANRLYSGAGFEEANRMHGWQWQGT
jgi:GNAT superfamily N-acetyltransferase